MDFLIHPFLAALSRYWVGPGLPSFSKKWKIWSFLCRSRSSTATVADILFLGVCGSSVIGSSPESTLIRANADMNSVHRLQLICWKYLSNRQWITVFRLRYRDQEWHWLIDINSSTPAFELTLPIYQKILNVRSLGMIFEDLRTMRCPLILCLLSILTVHVARRTAKSLPGNPITSMNAKSSRHSTQKYSLTLFEWQSNFSSSGEMALSLTRNGWK